MKKTECNHPLCNECKGKLTIMKCPYCREELYDSFEITIAFSHFVYLFNSFYKDNYQYQKLKEGIDLKSVITKEILFYIEEIDNFDDKGIRLKIYKHFYTFNKLMGSIVFSTPDLDEEKKEYRYITSKKKRYNY